LIRRSSAITAIRFALTLAVCAVLSARAVGAIRLGIRDTRFTINDRPAFLLGISYYGALGATPETWKSDLDRAQRYGFNWIRVWATWPGFDNDVSAVDSQGRPREPYLGRLKTLIADCDRRGIIVDVTLTRGNGANGSANLQGLEAHRRAVETLVSALKPWANWYFDLSNERNIGDARYTSMADLSALRDEVKRLDSRRLVTASQGGDISRGELNEYLNVARVDFVCPHRPRSAGTAGETEGTTKQLLTWMRDATRAVPVHFQEPFRRGYPGWDPSAADFLADLEAARRGGAAGWCFHNGSDRSAKDGKPRRSFDLRDGPLFSQIDHEERAFLAKLEERSIPVVTEDDPRPRFRLPPAFLGYLWDAVYDPKTKEFYFASWVDHVYRVRRFNEGGDTTGDWAMPENSLSVSIFHRVGDEVRLMIAIGTPMFADEQMVTFPRDGKLPANVMPLKQPYSDYDRFLNPKRQAECRKALLELKWPPTAGLHSVGASRNDRRSMEIHVNAWHANAQTGSDRIATNADHTRFVFGNGTASALLAFGERTGKSYRERDVRYTIFSALGWDPNRGGISLKSLTLRGNEAVISLEKWAEPESTYKVAWVNFLERRVTRQADGLLARNIDQFPLP
jgi:hypothetical protein